MTTWTQWMWFFLELKMLFEPAGGEPAPFPLPKNSSDFDIDWLSDYEESRHSVLERAVLAYTATGSFPPLEAQDRLLLSARISHAIQIAAANESVSSVDGTEVVPPPRADRETMIRWFLIDAWEPVGKSNWLDMAFLRLC